MGNDTEVRITYETLFDMSRLEKSRAELQTLPETFLEDLESYLNEKKKVVHQPSSDSSLFAADEKERALRQLSNIKKILIEFYERRERKIINLAIDKSRIQTSAIDMSSMISKEKILFEQLLDILNKQRNSVLIRLLGEEPTHESVDQSATEVKENNLTSNLPSETISQPSEEINEKPKIETTNKTIDTTSNEEYITSDEIESHGQKAPPDKDLSESEVTTAPLDIPDATQVNKHSDINQVMDKIKMPIAINTSNESPTKVDLKKPIENVSMSNAPIVNSVDTNKGSLPKVPEKLVRFLHALPSFVGRQLEKYGPYETEDMARLPGDIADILIEKKRAEEIKTNE